MISCPYSPRGDFGEVSADIPSHPICAATSSMFSFNNQTHLNASVSNLANTFRSPSVLAISCLQGFEKEKNNNNTLVQQGKQAADVMSFACCNLSRYMQVLGWSGQKLRD